MADVFISYSRKDREFVQTLNEALTRAGRDPWVDLEDIPPTAEWLREVYAGIEAADTVVFVLSPDSIASEVCGRELAHAVEHRKRLVPLVRRNVDQTAVPPELAARNWLLFREGDDFEAAFQRLLNALDTDLEWVREHTRLLTRAIEWDSEARDASLLLRGSDLRDAEQWLARVGSEKEPQPTPLQTQYLLASRATATKQQRVVLGAVTLGLLVAIGLGVGLWFARNDAVFQADAALKAQATAVTEAEVRATAQAETEVRRQEAVAAQATAVTEAQVRATAQTMAEDRRRVAVSRQLAAQALTSLDDQPDLALLLATEATRAEETFESRSALLRSLIRTPGLTGVLTADENVAELALSKDGRFLAGGGDRGSVMVWDISSRRLLWSKGRDEISASRVDLSPDGRYIASGNFKGQKLRLWDTTNGAIVAEQDKWVDVLAFSPDGKTLAVLGYDQASGVYEIPSLRQIKALPDFRQAVAFSPDGTRLATGARGYEGGKYVSEFVLWDLATMTQTELPEPRGASESLTLAFSADGGKLVASGEQGLHVWDLRAKPPVLTEVVTGQPSARLSTAPGGKLLVWGSGSSGGPAEVDLTRSPPEVKKLAVEGSITDAVVLPDGQTVALARGMRVLLVDLSMSLPIQITLTGHTQTVTSLAFSPNSMLLASGSEDQNILRWDISRRAKMEPALTGHQGAVTGLAFSRNGNKLASAGGAPVTGTGGSQPGGPAPSPTSRPAPLPENDAIQVWDVASGKLEATLAQPGRQVLSLVFAVDDRALGAATAPRGSAAPGSTTGRQILTTFWSIETSQQLDQPLLTPAPPEGLGAQTTLSPDGARAAIVQSGHDNAGVTQDSVQIIDVERRTVLHQQLHVDMPLLRLVFSREGSLVAALGLTGASAQPGWGGAVIWDVATGVPLGPTLGRGDFFTSAAFSPDGRTFATLGFSGLEFWDIASQQRLSQPFGPTSATSSLQFSPDGKILAAGYEKGAIALWQATTQDWQEQACHLAGRDLTEAEWRQFFGAEVNYRPTCPGVAGVGQS